jgi:hypothetical protein
MLFHGYTPETPTPLTPLSYLYGIRFDNPACDRVNEPHTVLFAVTNQRLSNFSVSPISNCLSPHG